MLRYITACKARCHYLQKRLSAEKDLKTTKNMNKAGEIGITGQLGCVHRAKFLPSVGRGGGGRRVEKWVWSKGEIYPISGGIGGGGGKVSDK